MDFKEAVAIPDQSGKGCNTISKQFKGNHSTVDNRQLLSFLLMDAPTNSPLTLQGSEKLKENLRL